MIYADAAEIESQIKDITNAAKGVWGGPVVDPRRKAEAITAARRAAAKEVFKAIGSNPKSEYFGELFTLTDVEHNANLSGDAVFGVPLIVPFSGAEAREGFPADPDEIDSYRGDSATVPVYSGALDGLQVAHDQPDANGLPSPLSCRYAITAGRFKFTGFSAQVPVAEITEEMLDERVPYALAPTVVRRAVGLLVKEGDNLSLIAGAYMQEGRQDLMEMAGRTQPPATQPDIVRAQKQEI